MACAPGDGDQPGTVGDTAATSRERAPGPADAAAPGTTVAETWVSEWDDAPNLDSPAYWAGPDGGRVLVTAKEAHQLWVYDAATGELLDRVGGPGSGPGEFLRPNGIAVVDELVLVVERDNHRVQALELPGFEPRLTFGEAQLERPYGIAVRHHGGVLDVYVTDDYGNDVERPDSVAPTGDFTRRVKHYQLRLPDEGLTGAFLHPELVRSFGEAAGPGALRVVESIQLDPDRGQLLIADEFGFELELYDLDGRYLDSTVAGDVYRHGDPEGIMLYRCGDAAGYWVLTDQGTDRTVFHILDRVTMEPVGSFAGEVTANTDGIWLTQETVPGLGDGALFALHDDGGMSAFAWSDIADALGLRADCGP
jgi:3-phytase